LHTLELLVMMRQDSGEGALRKTIFAFAAASIVVASVFVPAAGQNNSGQANSDFDYLAVESINGDTITLRHYHAKSLDASTVDTPKNIKLTPDAATMLLALPNKTIMTQDQLSYFLISNGLAQVAGQEVPDNLTQAQAQAKIQKRGHWISLPEPSPPPQILPPPRIIYVPVRPTTPPPVSPFVKLAEGFYGIWKELVAAGLIGGVLSFTIRWIYRRFWVRRRVIVSVIGLKGSGKSSVLARIKNPNLTEEAIVKMSPTVAAETFDVRKPIPIGRYEVYARLHDNPGESWGAFFQSLSKKGRFGTNIALLVLAPTDELDATVENWRKEKYIVEQVGLAKGLIGGSLEAIGIHRPDLVIIYLNKFDLISQHNSEDSSSRQKVSEFREVFSPFLSLKAIAIHDRKSPTPIVRIVVGSALKDWGSKAIMSAIEEVLYMGGR
jgi:hypothetical protein